jgi:uncharacterized phiE125 gp8 family phage protein
VTATYVRTTDPATEPVSVAECKVALNVDSDITSDDALIAALISGAREYAEAYCNRSFVTQKWRLTLDSFTDVSAAGPGPFMGAIQIERGPIVSVDSIVYLDMAGIQQTITLPGTSQQTSTVANEQRFALNLDGKFGRLAPAFGYIWPITRPQLGAVQINFTAGFGAATVDQQGNTTTAVPLGIRNWIKMRVATLYQNREEVAVMPRGKVEALPYVDNLLDPYRVVLA